MRAMHPVKVFSTDNAISAEMAAGLLQKEEIPCYIKDLETGDYLSIYMGYSVFGKEIYVDEEDYERAKRLLDSVTPDKSNVEEDLKVKKRQDAENRSVVCLGYHSGADYYCLD